MYVGSGIQVAPGVTVLQKTCVIVGSGKGGGVGELDSVATAVTVDVSDAITVDVHAASSVCVGSSVGGTVVTVAVIVSVAVIVGTSCRAISRP
ncbi:MAG TPA: hypothetical protein DCK83_08645 [Gallionellaceae bacterium]|nr:hypothetical protein [Gallionellaceae bacterium]